MQFNTHRINDCSSYDDTFSIDFSFPIYIYIYIFASLPSLSADRSEKSWNLLFAWNFYIPKVYSPRPMFRSGEAAFEADTYYDRMPNYSAVPIISITLINRAVSEWNVRTNVRVCTSRDLCICNRPPCHQFAILIFTRASISRWPRSRDVSCTLVRLNWIYPTIFLFFFLRQPNMS